MKIGYMWRRNDARVVMFATATPVANSITDAYVMQRYLRPDLLEAAGISVFDTRAATFDQVVNQIELGTVPVPEGPDRKPRSQPDPIASSSPARWQRKAPRAGDSAGWPRR